jgi:hypothetical protein
LDDANEAAMRATLNLDVAGTDNSTNVTLAGSLDYITLSGQEITRNAIDLATDVTGALAATSGGTGQTSLADVDAGDFGSGAATAGQRMVADGSTGIDWKDEKGVLSFSLAGTITTGEKFWYTIPEDCEVESWQITADQSGSIVIDVWVEDYANYPPDNADSICAAAPPTLSGSIKAASSTLTGWTTALSSGDIIKFNVDSVSAVTRIELVLKIKKL